MDGWARVHLCAAELCSPPPLLCTCTLSHAISAGMAEHHVQAPLGWRLETRPLGTCERQRNPPEMGRLDLCYYLHIPPRRHAGFPSFW